MNSFTKCLVVFVLSLVSVASLKAEDFVIDGIYYSTESLPQGQVEIRGSRPPYVHDLVIPSTITSSSGRVLTVTRIADFALMNLVDLVSVEIPSTVTSIGARAFSGCDGLTSIEIPSSVTDINDSTFIWCYNLTSVEIPSSVKRIGDAAFYECYSLTSIEIPSSVTSIGARAFTDSKLVYVTLPASVVRLGEGAFSTMQ